MTRQIAIVSGKGGVGKSSLTTGLAAALTSRGKRVLLLDMDVGLRTLDRFHGISDKLVYDWGDVLAGRCEPEQAPTPAYGVWVLPAPRRLECAVSAEDFQKMLGQYQFFDYILLDAPAGLGTCFSLAAGAVQEALLVATPDSPAAHGAQEAALALDRIGLQKQRLLINRFRAEGVFRGKLLNIDEMIDTVGAQLIGVIPEDPDFSAGLSAGQPVFLQKGAGLSLNEVAGRLEGEEIPLKHLDKMGKIC